MPLKKPFHPQTHGVSRPSSPFLSEVSIGTIRSELKSLGRSGLGASLSAARMDLRSREAAGQSHESRSISLVTKMVR